LSEAEPRHAAEIAAAKINLALHVRGRLPDGRHALETLFAFCVDGDRVEGWWSEEGEGMSLEVGGPFGGQLGDGPNLIERAWELLQERAADDPVVEDRSFARVRRRAAAGRGRPRLPAQHELPWRRRG
jgi:4-diphosphocytidyl-2-C-methyl-D-erythritol kinase